MPQRLMPKGSQITQTMGIALSVALVVVLVWAAAASAQTPTDVPPLKRVRPRAAVAS